MTTKEQEERRRRPSVWLNPDRESIVRNYRNASPGKRIGHIIDRYGAIVAEYRRTIYQRFTEDEMLALSVAAATERFENPVTVAHQIAEIYERSPGASKALGRKVRALSLPETYALLEELMIMAEGENDK